LIYARVHPSISVQLSEIHRRSTKTDKCVDLTPAVEYL